MVILTFLRGKYEGKVVYIGENDVFKYS